MRILQMMCRGHIRGVIVNVAVDGCFKNKIESFHRVVCLLVVSHCKQILVIQYSADDPKELCSKTFPDVGQQFLRSTVIKHLLCTDALTTLEAEVFLSGSDLVSLVNLLLILSKYRLSRAILINAPTTSMENNSRGAVAGNSRIGGCCDVVECEFFAQVG